MGIESSLWVRKGNKLFVKDTEDFLEIVRSDNYYPEKIVCEDTDKVQLEFQQQSSTLYTFVRVVNG
jgi:hypothetical protein